MAGGYDRDHRNPFVPGAGASAYERSWQDRLGADADTAAGRRRSFTRPRRPGFCWVAVQLHGKDVDRPGLVARWVSTPHGWQALVAWSGLDGEVRVEWVGAERLTAVRPERAP